MPSFGRPQFTPEQFNLWLNELEPFLKRGKSLRSAIESAGLTKHKNVLYRYYRENEVFRDKIDYFQRYLGELVNEAFAIEINRIHEKTCRNEPLTRQEVKTFVFFASNHRSCQPFFVNRREVKKIGSGYDAEKLGKIIDALG
jgi:hypothetical protein